MMMHRIRQIIGAAVLCYGLSASAQVYGPYSGGNGPLRDPRYGSSGYGYSGGSLFDRVQNHLRRAASTSRLSGRERERFDNAFRHLSQFDSRLRQGRWDNGTLDSAIGDVQNVVNHNPLGPRERDALLVDLQQMREFRSSRGASTGYRQDGYGGYGQGGYDQGGYGRDRSYSRNGQRPYDYDRDGYRP